MDPRRKGVIIKQQLTYKIKKHDYTHEERARF